MARQTFRNRQGEPAEIPAVAATQAEDAFGETLDALSTKSEGLLKRMQTPVARKGMETAFHAAPETLGRAAAKAVRRNRARPQHDPAPAQ